MGATYVYGIRFGEYVKIGFTNNPVERLRQLKSRYKGTLLVPDDVDESDCEPLFAVYGDLHTEHLIHVMFASERALGEWYHYRGALRAWLDDVRLAKYTGAFTRYWFDRNEIVDEDPVIEPSAVDF